MNRIIEKAFYLNAWGIGWRRIGADSQTNLPINEKRVNYITLPVTDRYYYADPFIFEEDNNVYLFAECMDRYRGKGSISVSKYTGKRFSPMKEVLNEEFHLSYPNVFKYHNQYYMIPETGEAKQVRLYCAKYFPNNWELDTVLIDDGNSYVDTSFQFLNSDIIMYCYSETGGGTLRRFLVDMEHRKLHEVSASGYHIDRPGGNCFYVNGFCYRPLQNCRDYYGQGVKIYKDESGTESYVGEMTPENIDFSHSNIKLTGTHTLNRSEHFEVIDYKYNRFCVTKPWIHLSSQFYSRRNK